MEFDSRVEAVVPSDVADGISPFSREVECGWAMLALVEEW
jgi:hypothetical protein